MLKTTEMDEKTRKRERIETAVVVDTMQNMVKVEHFLPNGEPESLELFCTIWDTARPGLTCLDFQRVGTGGKNVSIQILGYTPEDIAEAFLTDYNARKAAR